MTADVATSASRTDDEESVPQLALFDLSDPWLEHWQGMPEFSHDNLEPTRSIIVHFETDQDVEAFEKIIGQNVGKTRKSLWFPEAEIGHYADKRYADEEGT